MIVSKPDFTPFGDMLNFYAEQDRLDCIWSYMDICGRTGLLYSSSTCFIMARPVDSSLPIEDLDSLKDTHPDYPSSGLTDAWYILYASGNLSHFLDKVPYDLPKVMWQRDGKGKAKIHLLSTLQKHIHG